MVVYTCSLCQKKFTLKGDYNRHINKKFPCVKEENSSDHVKNTILHTNPQNSTQIHNFTTQVINSSNIDEIIYKCKYCIKTFSRSDSLHRHEENYCKFKKIAEQKQKEEQSAIQLLAEQMRKHTEEANKKIDQLQKELTKSKRQILTNNINNINNGTINNGAVNNGIINNGAVNNGTIINNTTNICINFDDLDGSAIESKMSDELDLFWKVRSKDKLVDAVNKIFCNKNHPELHCVYIENKKMNQAMVLNKDNVFRPLPSQTAMFKLREAIGHAILIKIHDNNEDEYKYGVELLDEIDNHQAIDKTTLDQFRRMKYELYNNRNIIKATHNINTPLQNIMVNNVVNDNIGDNEKDDIIVIKKYIFPENELDAGLDRIIAEEEAKCLEQIRLSSFHDASL
jgi:uncharacterized C2H2 Zn-finger protein